MFNRSYWPDFGSTGQLLTELAEDLVAAHGFEVTVVCGYPLGRDRRDVPAREVRNGVEIVRAAGTTWSPRRFAGRATNYVTYFASAMLAGLHVRRPDVVMALTDPPIIGLAALATAERAGAPFVFLCEDVFPEVAVLVEDFHSDVVNAALTQVNRVLLSRANAVIALGETMKQRLEGKGADPARITVIDNWADTEALVPLGRRNAFSAAHALDDRIVVMHAGNIGLSQSLDTVIEAAGHLRHERAIVFVFLGDGARRSALETRVAAAGLDNVRFVPYQPRERMADAYAAADLFLVSLRAGLSGYIVPSKIYGILAAGRPYVAAVEDDCEVATLTRAQGCGIVVPPDDAVALAGAIAALATDPARREVLGARGRVAALYFDRRRQVGAYAALLREVAASHLSAAEPDARVSA